MERWLDSRTESESFDFMRPSFLFVIALIIVIGLCFLGEEALELDGFHTLVSSGKVHVFVSFYLYGLIRLLIEVARARSHLKNNVFMCNNLILGVPNI